MSKLTKYIFIPCIGLVGGFLGEETGVRLLYLFPAKLWSEGSIILGFLPLVASFVPFVIISTALIIGTQKYRSYLSGLVLSAAYYLPFHYRGIIASLKNLGSSFAYLGEVFLILALVTLILSAVYYILMKALCRKGRSGPNKSLQRMAYSPR